MLGRGGEHGKDGIPPWAQCILEHAVARPQSKDACWQHLCAHLTLLLVHCACSVQGTLIPLADLRSLNTHPTFYSFNPVIGELTPPQCQAPSKQGLINAIRGLPRALQLLLTIRLVIILSRSPCWFLNPNWQETPVSQWESWGRVSGWQQAPESSWVVGWMCASDLASNPYARFREFL